MCCNKYDRTDEHYLSVLNAIEKERAARLGKPPHNISMDSFVTVEDVISLLQNPAYGNVVSR